MRDEAREEREETRRGEDETHDGRLKYCQDTRADTNLCVCAVRENEVLLEAVLVTLVLLELLWRLRAASREPAPIRAVVHHLHVWPRDELAHLNSEMNAQQM